MQEQSHRPIFERHSETASIIEDAKSMDSGWDGRHNQAELNYDLNEALSQLRNEVLVIILVDFTS